MSNTSIEVRNYFKLELLIARSYILLRQLFKHRYSLFTGGQTWDDTSTCGNHYLTNVIAKNKKFNLTAIQKTSISNEWDLTILTAFLLNADRPKGLCAHQERRYSDAIILFTKATVLPGVSNRERATVYSNLSLSRLMLYEKEERTHFLLILQARNLLPTWWKGHFCVGKVYTALNEYEKAIQSFERALALDSANDEIQTALNESRQIHSRQLRYESLDPGLKPRTMPELLSELKEKFGTDPQHVRMGHDLQEKIDPAGADVVRGHKYTLGDINIKQDYEQAATYFAKAASKGNPEGMYNLALLYDSGLGVKKDLKMATKLFEQAADQPPQHPILKHLQNPGVAEAEHALGLRYVDGIDVKKNLSIAAQWYQRAIQHGSAQAANNLALMYQKGTGVEQNMGKAEQLFELAARRDDSNGMLNYISV